MPEQRKLDESRPYGKIYGRHIYRFQQDGYNFNGAKLEIDYNGNPIYMYDEPAAPLEAPVADQAPAAAATA